MSIWEELFKKYLQSLWSLFGPHYCCYLTTHYVDISSNTSLSNKNFIASLHHFLVCAFQGLGPLACLAELSSAFMNPFRHYGRIRWTRNRPVAKPLTLQNRTDTHNADIAMRRTGFKHTSQYSCSPRPYALTSHCLQLVFALHKILA